jgi:hypothetical protein
MSLLEKLFGKKGPNGGKTFREKDNAGTRQATLDQAVAYWNMRNMRQKFDPFVLYVFPTEAFARDALLELGCIHPAQDTGNLICTEPLIFGFYRIENGKYEAILAGESLSHELWQQAKLAFEKQGGQPKNTQEPELGAVPVPAKKVDFTGKVKLIRKYSEPNKPGSPTYEDYECADAELAKEYLLTKSVDKPQYYITVKTPLGVWGMDIKGLYKEHLLPWQITLAAGEIDGHTFGLADTFSLEMAARGANDNFVISVRCGSCSHEWTEGVRYQSWTVVECPNCHKRNRVASNNYSAVFVK